MDRHKIPFLYYFRINRVFFRVDGTPSVAGKITFTIRQLRDAGNEVVLTSAIWGTNYAQHSQMLGGTLTPFTDSGISPDGVQVIVNKIDGIVVNITDVTVIVYLEHIT